MEARRVLTNEWLTIASYGDGGFRVEAARHDGSILIHREAVTAWDGALEVGRMQALARLTPLVEILIIGTGERFDPSAAGLAAELRKIGMAVDIMATPAACRTYNLLISDGRVAAAALMAVP
ncbi:MAG: Mth938-like domain-containing protein [Geminicoccaceae bacterium]